MANDPFVFQPVRGTEEKIERIFKDIHDGYLYFAYDSGNIYLDKDGHRYLMGGTNGSGSSGFSWANGSEDDIIKVSEDEDDTSYKIPLSVLEDSTVPKVDSLILNSDGRFFRVMEIDIAENQIIANLIAVSGSGEGSGTIPSVNDLDLSWTGVDQLGSTFIYEKDAEITFIPNSLADEICSLTVSVTDLSGTEVFKRDFRVRNNQKCVINAKDFPVSDNLTITALVISDHSTYNRGRGLSKTFKPIKVLKMYLEKPTDVGMIGIQSTAARLSYNPYFTGLWTATNPVKIYYTIDGGEGILSKALVEGNDQNKQYIDIPHQPHGTHIIGLYLGVNINNKEYTSESIYYEVPFVDNGNEDPIIWTQEDLGTIVQYEPAVVKYMVYSSVAATTGANIEVQFLQDGVLFDTAEITYGNRWQTLDLTSKYVVGENHFSIVSGGTRKDIDFNITSEGARSLDIIHDDELEINFDSMGHSNKQIKVNRANFTSMATPKFADSPYKATLNNFNWYNNGWLDDNDGNGSYLAVSNGASVTIPMNTISINTNDQPWTFEIRFRIRNAKKFATLVTEIPIYIWKDANGEECAPGKELTLEEIAAQGGTPIKDADGNLVMNEANTTRKEVRSDKYIAFKYLNNDNKGFAIGSQEAYFNVGGRVVNVKYREDEIINISFVIDKAKNQLSIYLNGILSGVGDLSGISGFSMVNIPFTINSDYCDFDLYKFRVYPLALTMPEIIHNYISDMKNIDLYDENQLTDINDDTKLSYQKLLNYNETHKNSPTMPYIVIDMTRETSTGNTELPYAKTAAGIDGTRIEFTNPTADYLLSTEQISQWDYYTRCPSYSANNVNINVQGTSSQIYPRRNFKTKFKKAKQWIYTAGKLAGLPVNYSYFFNSDGSIDDNIITQCVAIQDEITELEKNKDANKAAIKAKKAELKTLGAGKKSLSKNWHEDSESFGSNKFTWKVDYMESSGSYNTGFANLMGNRIYNKHPLDDLGIDGSDYRTSIYGFPMLAFHKTAENTYTYIGRYNCNLDKSANERYGFELEEPQPYLVDEEGNHPLIADVAECWELRDNQGLWCSFRYPTNARERGFETPISDIDPGIEVVKHFEARYHAKADQFEWGQNVIIGKENTENYSEEVGTDKETINGYLLDKLKNLKVLFEWLDSTDPKSVTNKSLLETIGQESKTYKVSSALSEDQAITQGITYYIDNSSGSPVRMGTFTKDSAEYRRQKFYAEFSEHLDKHYCAVYFVMTELLLCYDSRGKNMMIASFGPTKAGGDYIWYPIFYDIDTQLGLNNVGAQLWGYDENCTENGTFSTAQSVLWMNFNDLFKEDIISTYRTLRGGGEDAILSYKNIEGAYTCDPNVFKSSIAMRGRRPIIAMGLDEYYKYVLPVSEAWRNQEGNMITANYLYACQGDRKLSRELLINNRLLYMDSKWLGGAFTISTGGMAGIMFRSTANHETTTSDKYIDLQNPDTLQPGDNYTMVIEDDSGRTEHKYIYQPYQVMKYIDATPQYNVTPYLNFYITTFVDENTFQNDEAFNEDKYPNGMPTKVLDSVTEAYQYGRVDQQLNYFAGSSYISSLGDLSTKYANQVKIPNTPRLLDITLGSDAPGYFNNENLNPFELYTEIDDATGLPKDGALKPLLNKIILSNLRGLNTYLDVRSPDKLTEFRALGTSLTYALFAEGAPLRIVHLPESVQKLIFIQNKNLTKIIKSAPIVAEMDGDNLVYKNPSTYEGLYVAGLTDYIDSIENRGQGSPIEEIDIEGDAMGYDSYTLLNNLVLQKYGSGVDKRLAIKMTDVNWSPYIQVEYGENKNEDETYYLLTEHSTYELYDDTDRDWDSDTLNGKVFIFDNTAPKATISDLSLLDIFLRDYENTTSGINQFTNNVESELSNKTYPALSGQLFVANGDAEEGIGETALSKVYGAAWPNLVIRAEKIEKSYLTKYVEIDPNSNKEIVLDDKTFSDENTINLAPASRLKVPTRTHYDFKGFSPIIPDNKTIPTLYVVRNAAGTDWELTEEGATAIIDGETKVQVLYAVFVPHPYQISYYYKDGTLIEIVDSPYSPEKGSVLQPSIIPHMDESNLSITMKYAFLGYSENINSEQLVDFSSRTSNRDMTFYAVFEEKSVYEDVAKEEYFTYELINGGYTDNINSKPIDANYNVSGPVCYIKPKANIKLSGKITLPAKITITIDGSPTEVTVAGIAGQAFQDNADITHIFFEPFDSTENNAFAYSKYRYIGDYAFSGASNLVYIDFTNTGKGLRAFGRDTFAYCSKLTSYQLPPHLIDLGGKAFLYAFDGQNDMTIIVNSELRRLGSSAFANVYLGQRCALEIGSQDNPSQIDLTFTSSAGTSGDGRLARVLQYMNGEWERIDFWSSNYESKDTIVNVFNKNTTVADAFDVKNSDVVVSVNGMY